MRNKVVKVFSKGWLYALKAVCKVIPTTNSGNSVFGSISSDFPARCSGLPPAHFLPCSTVDMDMYWDRLACNTASSEWEKQATFESLFVMLETLAMSR